jgi:hypothetical protein
MEGFAALSAMKAAPNPPECAMVPSILDISLARVADGG